MSVLQVVLTAAIAVFVLPLCVLSLGFAGRSRCQDDDYTDGHVR
jgi:hypothetical protein